MKNDKASWCAICETKNHNMANFHLNLKNRKNYHAVYQTNAVAQNNEQNNTPDTSASMTIDVEAMEVEVDSLVIETTDHVGPSNV